MNGESRLIIESDLDPRGAVHASRSRRRLPPKVMACASLPVAVAFFSVPVTGGEPAVGASFGPGDVRAQRGRASMVRFVAYAHGPLNP